MTRWGTLGITWPPASILNMSVAVFYNYIYFMWNSIKYECHKNATVGLTYGGALMGLPLQDNHKLSRANRDPLILKIWAPKFPELLQRYRPRFLPQRRAVGLKGTDCELAVTRYCRYDTWISSPPPA